MGIWRVNKGDPEMNQSIVERLVTLIQKTPSISRSELARLLQLSERQTRKIIDQLRNDGKLKREGSDYSGKWVIIGKSK